MGTDSVNTILMPDFGKYTKSLSVALDYRDKSTFIHSHRVAGISRELGACCGLSHKELALLEISAFFHDIGKIGIPDLVLIKPARLNKDEYLQMKNHCEIGENILKSSEFEGSEMVALAIRHHHEYFNGEGYPDRIAGEDIPIFSRIIGIADNYDAMAYPRYYILAKNHREIMEIIFNETGTKHDPYLINLFFERMETSQFKAPAA